MNSHDLKYFSIHFTFYVALFLKNGFKTIFKLILWYGPRNLFLICTGTFITIFAKMREKTLLYDQMVNSSNSSPFHIVQSPSQSSLFPSLVSLTYYLCFSYLIEFFYPCQSE
jgi:hypothetical protein